jgi:hypothetical protein
MLLEQLIMEQLSRAGQAIEIYMIDVAGTADHGAANHGTADRG